MQIIIDGVKVDLELPKREVTLKHVINEVEDFLIKVGKLPVGLKFNGQELSQKELDAKESCVLTGREILDFAVRDGIDFLIDNVDGVISGAKAFRERIWRFSCSLQQGKPTAEPHVILKELNDFFEFWVHLSQLVPDVIQATKIHATTFTECFKSINSLLKEAVAAMQKQDNALAGDLMCYEVIPRIDSLQNALPEIRKGIVHLKSAK